MATLDWKLDMIGTLELEDDCPDHIHIHSTDVLSLSSADCHDPGYSSLVILSADLLIVIDNKANTLRLHSCSDGKLLALSEILSGPQDVCLVNGIGTQVAVAQLDGCITILSVESAGHPAVVKFRQLRLLDVTSEFKHCYGLRALKSEEKLAVSGSKWDKDSCEDWICWGLVSLVDGHVSTVYKICRGAGYSYLHTSSDDSTVYISCHAGYDSEDNGVYAFNVTDGKKFFSFCRDMKRPEGITVDRRGFIYVCDWCCSCIYQLTPQGKLVTVHSQGMLPWPQAMYCGEQQEKLYITTWWSNKIRIFLPVWKEKKGLVSPADLSKMDTRSLHMYSEAFENKRERVYNIRVMVVGHIGVGKTTLVKRLLGEEVNISERRSTEGINVHTECCRVSLKTGEWTRQGKDSEQDYRLQRLARVINAKQSQFNITDEEQVVIPPPGEITHESNVRDHAAYSDGDALVSVSDFAGQYAFYSTHQMFLTRRAIYLLVLDVSQLISDLVDDEWFFDYEGKMKYKVHDLVEVWMNTIHSCAQLPEDGTPPVILVGTHVDKIPQHNRHEVCNRYFREIRSYLEDKPSRFHLVDEDFVIDNTVVDSRLEDLKRKIVEVASQQPYWGEEIPTYWLLLEQQLMKMRDAGVKVVPLSLVQDLNNSGSVRIEDRHELDPFLEFQHDMGTVLYFSVEVLRENVVLDPQWLIDALKSLITAEFLVLRNVPEVGDKWFELKEYGRLTPELIDAIWTRDRFPDFHDNKGHILLLLEHLNIIVTPRVYNEDGSEIREENYFLVPLMLRQSTPREIISPLPHPQMESSSVLCYVFLGKFLPTAIFHQLLAACVAHWPIARKKREEMLETQIFCYCCVFQLDLYHKLTLHTREYVIFVRVTRKGIANKTPSSKLCIEAREFITTNLLKIIGYRGQSLKFEYFIQCPEYSGVNINSLIPVSILKENVEVYCDLHDNIIESCHLLRFWFEDQEQSGDSGACVFVLIVNSYPQQRNLNAAMKFLKHTTKSLALMKHCNVKLTILGSQQFVWTGMYLRQHIISTNSNMINTWKTAMRGGGTWHIGRLFGGVGVSWAKKSEFHCQHVLSIKLDKLSHVISMLDSNGLTSF